MTWVCAGECSNLLSFVSYNVMLCINGNVRDYIVLTRKRLDQFSSIVPLKKQLNLFTTTALGKNELAIAYRGGCCKDVLISVSAQSERNVLVVEEIWL